MFTLNANRSKIELVKYKTTQQNVTQRFPVATFSVAKLGIACARLRITYA